MSKRNEEKTIYSDPPRTDWSGDPREIGGKHARANATISYDSASKLLTLGGWHDSDEMLTPHVVSLWYFLAELGISGPDITEALDEIDARTRTGGQ